jgi:hypothetical protein
MKLSFTLPLNVVGLRGNLRGNHRVVSRRCLRLDLAQDTSRITIFAP